MRPGAGVVIVTGVVVAGWLMGASVALAHGAPPACQEMTVGPAPPVGSRPGWFRFTIVPVSNLGIGGYRFTWNGVSATMQADRPWADIQLPSTGTLTVFGQVLGLDNTATPIATSCSATVAGGSTNTLSPRPSPSGAVLGTAAPLPATGGASSWPVVPGVVVMGWAAVAYWRVRRRS